MNLIPWLNAFAETLESYRKEIYETAFYDKQHHCFVFSSDPMTFAEIMESAENNAFEEYDGLPDWDVKDSEAERMFHVEYLDKIKPICQAWEHHIMKAAENYDKYYVFDYDGESTATEYFTKYFKRFWDN